MFYIIVISYLIDYVSSESTLLGKCTVKSDLTDSRLDQLVGNDYETSHKRDYDGKKSNFRFNFCGDGLSYATVSVEQVGKRTHIGTILKNSMRMTESFKIAPMCSFPLFDMAWT